MLAKQVKIVSLSRIDDVEWIIQHSLLLPSLGVEREGWGLEVFNRWGRAVYQNANYANDWGSGAAPGVYYYLLKRGSTVHKGWVTVIR